MPFTVQCSSCQSKFALPDSAYEQRIAGKVVDLTCKHCRKNIRIDGTRPRSDAPTNEVTKTARPEQPAAAEVAPSALRASPASAGARSDTRDATGTRSTAREGLDEGRRPRAVDPNATARPPSVQAAASSDRSPGASSSSSSTGSSAFESVQPQLKPPSRVDLGGAASAAERSIRVPLPTSGAAHPSSKSAAHAVAPGRASAPKAEHDVTKPITLDPAPLDAEDDDRPTAILDRVNLGAVAPKPPPRRSPALKATMMGVAPPPNARLRPPPPRRQASPSPDASRTALRAERSVDKAVALAQTITVGGPSGLPRAGAPRAKLGGGTMLGLAPPPPPAELPKAGQPAASTSGEPVDSPPAASVTEGPGDAVPQVLATDDAPAEASSAQAAPRTEALTSPAATGAGAAGLELDFDDDAVTRVEQGIERELQNFAQQPEPIGLPPPAEAPESSAEAAPLDQAALHGDVPAGEWESATSDVSRQIAQSVPNVAPRRTRGRWLLAALVAIVGGAGAVGFLVVDGRLKLPPGVQQLTARYLPALQPMAAASDDATVPAHAGVAADSFDEPVAPAAAELPEKGSSASTAEGAPGQTAPPASIDVNTAGAQEEPPADDGVAEPDGEDEPADRGTAASETAGLEPDTAVPAARADQPAAATSDDDSPGPLAEIDVPSGMQPRLAQPVSTVPDTVNVASVQHRTRLSMVRAEKCHLGGRATGTATVMITFGPKGVVTDAAVVGEPIASAPVSTCLLTYARSVVLPEYDGAPFTVAYPITLR